MREEAAGPDPGNPTEPAQRRILAGSALAATSWLTLGTIALTAQGSTHLQGTAPGDQVTDVLSWQAWQEGTWPIVGHFTLAGAPHPGPGYLAALIGPGEMLGRLTGAPYGSLTAWTVIVGAIALWVTAGALGRITAQPIRTTALLLTGLLLLAWLPTPVGPGTLGVGPVLLLSSLAGVSAVIAAAQGRPGYAPLAAAAGTLIGHTYIASLPLGTAIVAGALLLAKPGWTRWTTTAITGLFVVPLALRALLLPDSLTSFLRPTNLNATMTLDQRTGIAFPDAPLGYGASTAASMPPLLLGLLLGTAVTVASATYLMRHTRSRAALILAGALAAGPLLLVSSGSGTRPWAWGPLIGVMLVSASITGGLIPSPRVLRTKRAWRAAASATSGALVGILAVAATGELVQRVSIPVVVAEGLSAQLAASGQDIVIAIPPVREDESIFDAVHPLMQVALETQRQGVGACLAFDQDAGAGTGEKQTLAMAGPQVWCQADDLSGTRQIYTIAKGTPAPGTPVAYQTTPGDPLQAFVVRGGTPRLIFDAVLTPPR